MSEFIWYDLHPPRNLTLASITGLMRALAQRSPRGMMRITPPIVVESWSHQGEMRWLLGIASSLGSGFVQQLRGQLPELAIVLRETPRRPVMELAVDVRLSNMSFPLRLDVAPSVSTGVLTALGGLAARESAVVQWVIGPSHTRHREPKEFSVREALGITNPTPPDATTRQAWRAKIAEPLFGVRCRIAATAPASERMHVIARSLVHALSVANSASCQLRASAATTWRARSVTTAYRLGSLWSSVVNAAELAELLGWPLEGVEIPGQPLQLAPAPRRLLIPPDDPRLQQGTRVLGVGLHPADGRQLVAVPLASSHHNLVVNGPTGSGKSALLAQLILSHAKAGHAIVTIEPRGDLVADVLRRMPTVRHGDVIVIDPADANQVGFNPLAGPPQDAERRADELGGLFRQIFGAAIGPRSSDVLLHTLLTAARMPDGTLADVPILLSNAAFRREALSKINDPLTLGPWWAWFESVSEAERQQIAAPIMNKLRAFLSRQSIRRMLGQSQPKFSFDEVFTQRPRIVLVNLNRGVNGPEASRLLGSLLFTSGWQAMQRRAKLAPANRFPVAWFVDEFQDYVGALDFGEVLAQIRGLGGFVVAAHQHQAQLSTKLQAATTANARSRISFRPSPADAKTLAAIYGDPATPDELARLGAFEVCAQLYVGNTMSQPFAVKTLPLLPPSADMSVLRQDSQQRYASSGSAVDAALRERWYGGNTPPGSPIGLRRRNHK
ncbi:DEAD/DEAH box helicase [Actinomadura sp. 3N508]|uniref:type IV secretory system conjugative DNA transfer family protein n=1 Tax=Actinomadura sp. 3N508 TaxID=3375153 RepID=UPI0037B41A8F